jgi:uncharacterized membrane protein YoaK (UPF0700 family)
MDHPHLLKPNAALAPACLAFVAGFADAASFVGADGIFCAHVTGNFVVLAADLARGASADEWLKLATFPLFVATVLAVTALHARREGGAAGPSLLASAGLFAAAALVAARWSAAAPGPARSAVVALLVVAMGAQNALHRLSPALGPMTTVMTGNVTGWLVETIAPGPPGAASKHRTVGAVIAAFAAGCAAGALAVARGGFVTLVVPAALLLFVRWRLPSPAAAAMPAAEARVLK